MKIKKPFNVSFKFKLSLEWPVDRNPCINISVTRSGGDKRNQRGPRSLDPINAHDSTVGTLVLVEKVFPGLAEWPPSTRTSDGKSHISSKWPTTNCWPKTPKDFNTMIKKSGNEEKIYSLWESCGESWQVEVDPDSRGKLNSRSFIREEPKIQANLLNSGKHWNLALLHYITPSFMVCETLLWGKIWPCEWDISLMLWCKLKPVCTSAVQTSAREGNLEAPGGYLPAPRVKTWSCCQWPVIHAGSSTQSHSHSLQRSAWQSHTNESSTCISLKDGVKDKAENVKWEKRHGSFILVSGVNSQRLSCVIAASGL